MLIACVTPDGFNSAPNVRTHSASNTFKNAINSSKYNFSETSPQSPDCSVLSLMSIPFCPASIAAGFAQGWQYYICSFVEHRFRELVVVPRCDDSLRALLLSQSSSPACAWLRAIPFEPALQMTPLRFQAAVHRRLRWPLSLPQARVKQYI